MKRLILLGLLCLTLSAHADVPASPEVEGGAPIATAAAGHLHSGISVVSMTSVRQQVKQNPDYKDVKLPSVDGGAFVTDVEDGGPGAMAGLKKGDVVVRIGDTFIRDDQSAIAWIKTARAGTPYRVLYQRQDGDHNSWRAATTKLTLVPEPNDDAEQPADFHAVAMPLESLEKNLRNDAMMRTVQWSLHRLTPDDDSPKGKNEALKNRLRSSEEAIKTVSQWQNELISKTEQDWVKANAQTWHSVLNDLIYAGGPTTGFLAGPPFRIYDDAGKKCFLLHGVASTTLYNLQKTTERTRATSEYQEHIAHDLPKMTKGLAGSDIQEVGMMVTYGVKDFTEDVSLTKEEGLIVISSLDNAKAFADNKITEDDFVDKSTVYVFVSPTTLKKIKIKLE